MYNSENIRYIIEVYKYKDIFNIDILKWKKRWIELDIEVENIFECDNYDNQEEWPSSLVSEDHARILIRNIWKSFIDVNGEYAISIHSNVANRIQNRVRHLHIYGPYIFDESLQDIIRYVHREIRPLFIKSKQYNTMKKRYKELHTCTINTFQIPYPPGNITMYSNEEDLPDDRLFTLDEILNCSFLFEYFYDFMLHKMTIENLFCFRFITIFKSHFIIGIDKCHYPSNYSEEDAWKIYKYFIAPKSPYEISVRGDIRKLIELDLASPKYETFDEVAKSVQLALRLEFAEFKMTKSYMDLSRVARQECIERNQKIQQCADLWG